MQSSRFKSVLLAGSLTTVAAAMAATAAAPTPVAAAGHPVQMAKNSKKTTGQATPNPCGPGRGSPNGSPYGTNPCNPSN